MKNRITNFGFSTILISFTMVCILIFSVLSLVTANSDYKLSKKVADKNKAYYQAEEQAYDVISQIDYKLYEAYNSCTSESDYYNKAKYSLVDLAKSSGENEYSLSYFLSDNQSLEIKLEVKYPSTPEDNFYRILSWNNKVNTSVDDEKYLDLID